MGRRLTAPRFGSGRISAMGTFRLHKTIVSPLATFPRYREMVGLGFVNVQPDHGSIVNWKVN